MVCYFHLFRNFTQVVVIPTIKGFSVVNEAEVGVFLKLSCFFYDPMDVGNLISAKALDCVDHNKLWKILKEMGIPDHLTKKNLYAGQEATVRTGCGRTDCFQIGKGVHQGCLLSPCLLNFYAEYIMRTLGWKKHKLESRLPGEISITSDMQMTPPLWQKVKN